MYKTLTVSSFIMILAFSGYISEDKQLISPVSIEINFLEETQLKDAPSKVDSKKILKSNMFNHYSQGRLIESPSLKEEVSIIKNFTKEHQTPLDFLLSNDKNFGTLQEFKPLLDNYYLYLESLEELRNRISILEERKLFWQHDKFGRIRAIYLNGYLYGNESFREKIHNLISTSLINAVVIDIKSDNGHILFETNNDEAIELNAVRKKYDKETLNYYKENNIYLIGRLVAFQDPIYAINNHESAVWDTQNNRPYRQGQQYFLDPSDSAVQEYILNIAIEACRLGFNEIQFDYIRYPDSNYRYMKFDLESTTENRTETITNFLSKVRDKLHLENCLISADIFGFVLTNKSDGGIGQNLESIYEAVDFVSPMIYPSHYSKGSFGYSHPNSYPFEVVTAALEDGLEREDNIHKLRPYLQGFWHSNEEIKEGIRAAEAKNLSWIMWNSLSSYSVNVFEGD